MNECHALLNDYYIFIYCQKNLYSMLFPYVVQFLKNPCAIQILWTHVLKEIVAFLVFIQVIE